MLVKHFWSWVGIQQKDKREETNDNTKAYYELNNEIFSLTWGQAKKNFMRPILISH